MKEIEILVEVYDDFNSIKKKFKDFEYVGLKRTVDEYYYDPKRETLKPDKNNQLDHCLRLRSANKVYSITYKDDVFDNGIWLYSNEYETKVESIKVVREITGLGLVDAKALADKGGNIKENVPAEEANDIKAKLEEAGAEVELA